MKFTEPVVELISIYNEDVIVTSVICFCIGDPDDPEMKPMP